jgi:hypothetical protein
MAWIVALLTLVFAHPSIQPAKPGPIEEKLDWISYVISPEGAFKVEKQKAQRTPKIFHPAFVLSFEGKFRVGLKPVEKDGVTVLANQIVRYTDGFLVHKGPSSLAAREVDSAASVVAAPSGDEYLLVRWQSDAGKCEFSLFAVVEDTLKEAATNAYSCEH